MKERPILFSAPMVRAILSGKKTQTRRILKMPDGLHEEFCGQSEVIPVNNVAPELGPHWIAYCAEYPEEGGSVPFKCPHGRLGDRLWVRETAWIAPPDFARPDPAWPLDNLGRRRCISWDASADGDGKEAARSYGVKKTPSIHMPRWASRITLEITGVRVERLRDISEDDARAEGLTSGCKDGKLEKYGLDTMPWRDWDRNPRHVFFALWESIYGEKSYEENPWVWVIEFRRAQ